LTKARKEIKQVLQVINDNKDDIVKWFTNAIKQRLNNESTTKRSTKNV
jgi:hypothetical protein